MSKNKLNDIIYGILASRDIMEAISDIFSNPAVMFKPRVFSDGKRWVAQYGDESGWRGFGDTPYDAIEDFKERYYDVAPEFAEVKP